MSAAEVLSMVLARLDYLLQIDEASQTHKRSVFSEDSVLDLREQLVTVHVPPTRYLERRDFYSDYNNQRLIELAYDVENTVEYLQLVRPGGRQSNCIHSKRPAVAVGTRTNDLFKRIRFLRELDELRMKHAFTESDDIPRKFPRGCSSKEYHGDTIWKYPAATSPHHHIISIDGNDDDMLGMEEFVDALNNLIRRPHARVVIVGMLGSGKTTIARKLFFFGHGDDDDVFDYRVWVTVSKDYSYRDIIETIAFGILNHHSENNLTRNKIRNLGTGVVLEQLQEVINKSRCLIVLDDVWSAEVWETLDSSLPHACFLSTAREERLANRSPHAYAYQIPRLTVAESRKLFLKELTQKCPLTESAEEVLHRCDGLPLAIVEAAKYLTGDKDKNWNKILEHMSKDTRIPDTVYPSYDCLTVLKKLCLLYMGLFPPGQQIPVDKLFLLWMAEGMVSSIDIAEEYLSALADGNLVQVQEEHGIRSCLPHDLIRVFCHSELRKDFNKYRVASYLKPSKLSSPFPNSTTFLGRHRSLLIFRTEDPQIRKSEWRNGKEDQGVTGFKHFVWMRTLDFNALDSRQDDNKFLTGIDELLYLRYLGFKDCYLDELPLSCNNFPFLETLDLRVRSSSYNRILTIPNVLWKLHRLRHLYFPLAYQTDDKQIKLELHGLRRLEILENFHLGVCDVNDLLGMIYHLQSFSVTADGSCISDLYKLVPIRPLCILALSLVNFSCYSEQRVSILANLLKCVDVGTLHLEGQMDRAPRGLQRLTNIVFDGCKFIEDPMPELGRLKQLRSLVLCNDAIDVEEICCTLSSFRKLTSLKMANLQSLEIWGVEEGAMSELSILTIENCPKLQVSHKLIEIRSLKKLEIGSMPKQFQENVLNILQDSGKRLSTSLSMHKNMHNIEIINSTISSDSLGDEVRS